LTSAAGASALAQDDIPPTVPAAVRRAARRWPDEDAVVDGGQRVSWAELADRMTSAGRAFTASGVRPGDRVALWAPNSLDWIIAANGVYAAGGVLVPVNTRFKGQEAAHVLRTAGARILVTGTDFLGADYIGMLAADQGLLAGLEIVVLSGPPGDATPWTRFLERGQGDAGREGNNGGAGPGAAELALGPDDTSDIIFTSGTTGTPKGAVLTRGASTRSYVAWSRNVGLRHGDRYLVVYPFFHCAGLKSAVLACVLSGATIVPCPVFDVPAVMDLVVKEHITMLPGPPTLYQSMLNADLSGYDTSTLRLAVTGAASVPVDLVRRMRSGLGFASVVTAYGLTETTGTVSTCLHDDPIEVITNTSGRPLPGMQVRVVDLAGADVPVGEAGEVWVRGYAVTPGYFNAPEATAAAFTPEGWLRTGDVGVPDERLGEVGFAWVIPRQGSTPTEAELIAWCREQMANFKVPRHVELVPSLPLNPSGKVLKFELRDRVRAGLPGCG